MPLRAMSCRNSRASRTFLRGLRHRTPVRPEVSRTYRRNFETFASPWWISRPLSRLVVETLVPSRSGTGDVGRRDRWIAERARFYPAGPGLLEL